jgi:uncharacterized secreted protein with C-terminal beta-propeller domain
VLVVLGAMVVVAAVVLPIAFDRDEAAADELQPFESCAELAGWQAAEPAVAESGEALAASGDDAVPAPASTMAGREAATADASGGAAGDGDTGDTNVVVEGVDELDIVDRIDDTHVLVTEYGGGLHLVDLAGPAVVASIEAPFDARVSFDRQRSLVWLLGGDDQGHTVVQRIAVGDAELTVQGEWTTSGWLVDARRTDDRLHVVVAESFYPEGDVVPFAEGPVPCDRVLHPVGPSAPAATLLVTLPADGDVAPTAATEVVGSGELVHVTTDAAYLATPQWDGDQAATSIHRFDLADLTHTGSGRVEGTLLNQFSMSAFEGHLRVAVSQGGGFFGRAIEDVAVLEDDVATDVPAPAPPPDDAVSSDVVTTVVEPEPTVTIEPEPTVTIEPDPAVEPLNEIVVLDTEDDLDVVGRTERFGHQGETLHGVRFDGDIAYAVTFLVTDPFFVVDLADPTAPAVVGEVELPGFSAYLHPIGDGLVAGFGPDDDGHASVKLFDVSDPASPHLVDSERLGDESAVVWDHHAYLGLGEGRFAVPASTWRSVDTPGCTEAVRQQRQVEIDGLQRELNAIYSSSTPDEPRRAVLERQLEAAYGDPCISPPVVTDTSVVVGTVTPEGITIERPVTVTAGEPGTRLIAVDGGWAVLAGPHLFVTDAAGTTTDLDLS